MEKKLKVLYISQKPCIPTVDGGAFAILNFFTNITKLQNLEIIYTPITTPKHPFDNTAFNHEFNQITPIPLKINPDRLNCNLMNVFSSMPINVRRYHQKHLLNKISSLDVKNSFQWIICDGFYTLTLIPENWFSQKKILYRAHNIEADHWLQRSSFSGGFKQHFYKIISKKLYAYEKSLIKKCSAIFCLSAYDAAFIGEHFNPKTQLLYPTIPYRPTSESPLRDSFYFIGNCNWAPNLDGLKIFIEKVWPRIIQKIPQATFHLAGKNTEQFTNVATGVIGYGYVPNLKAFVANKSCMLSPLRMATGLNIKILENMAMGKPCIITPESAKSFPNNYRILSIHPLLDGFAEACISFSEHSTIQEENINSAKAFVEEHCHQPTQIQKLATFFNEQ